jgi:methyl-accepting chemotaxis protein
VKLVGESGASLEGIVDKVGEIDGLISEIARSSQEQATGLNQVNSAVNQMDQVTQQNAAMVEETTAAASNLRTEAHELADLMTRFKTGAAVAQAAPARGHRRPGARAA